MATLDQFAQEMALEFGEQYGDLDIKDQFQRWVQEVYERLVTSGRWLFTNAFGSLPMTEGLGEYELAATVAEVRDVQLSYIGSTARSRVVYTPVERLIARGEALTALGVPRAWYYSGIGAGATLKITLWPVPNADTANDANLVVHTLSRPAVLGEDDEIPVPLEYLRVLREGVRARVKYNDNDLQGASLAEQAFLAGVEELNNRFGGTQRGGSRLQVNRLRGIRQAPAADGS